MIVLSATSGGVCIFSSVSIVGTPVGIAGVSFTLIFSVTRIINKLLSITKKKRNDKIKKSNQKHDKILMLAKSKLNSIDTLVLQALINMEISHEEFDTIMKEKKNMKRWKKMWGMSVKNKKIWDWTLLIQ